MKKLLITTVALTFPIIGCSSNLVSNNSSVKSVYSFSQSVSDWRSDRIVGAEKKTFKTQAISNHIKADLTTPTVATLPITPIAKFTWAKSVNANSSPAMSVNSGSTPSVMYFVTDNSSGSNVHAVNVTSTNTSVSGGLKWQRALGGSFSGSSPSIITSGSKNKIYVNNGKLSCLDADTGNTIAETVISDTFKNSSPWVVASLSDNCDYIYLTGQSGNLYKYRLIWGNSSLDLMYSKALGGAFSSSPVYNAATSRIYIGSESGKLYEVADNGSLITEWNLTSGTGVSRNSAGKVLASPVIDDISKIALVPCGGYLFRINLNDSSVTQSPLLEMRQNLLASNGDIVRREPATATNNTISGATAPTVNSFKVGDSGGFAIGDTLKIKVDMGTTVPSTTAATSATISFSLNAFTDLVPGNNIRVYDSNGNMYSGQIAATWDGSTNPIKLTTAGLTPPHNIVAGDYVRKEYPVIAPLGDFSVADVADILPNDNLTFYDSSNVAYTGSVSGAWGGANPITLAGALTPAYAPVVTDTCVLTDEKYNVTTPGEITFNVTSAASLSIGNYIKISAAENIGQIANISGVTVTLTSAGITPAINVANTNVVKKIYSSSGYEYTTITGIDSVTDLITVSPALPSTNNLVGSKVYVVQNNPYYGKTYLSGYEPIGDIKSAPSSDGTYVYVGNNNALFELNYTDSSQFAGTATYCLGQAARMDSSGLNLQRVNQAGGAKLVNDTNNNRKLIFMIDEDATLNTGTFINRFSTPLSGSYDRLNSFFPITEPNSLGQIASRNAFPLALGAPITIEDGTKGYWGFFAGGNGIIYGLSLVNGWNY